MFKKCLISLLVLSLTLGSTGVVFAKNKIENYSEKIKQETKIGICTEIFLKKGTIIRSSNIAFLTENPTTNSPKYTTRYTGNDQLVFLIKDTQIYLTNGGYICKIGLENCIKKLSKIDINIKTINIY